VARPRQESASEDRDTTQGIWTQPDRNSTLPHVVQHDPAPGASRRTRLQGRGLPDLVLGGPLRPVRASSSAHVRLSGGHHHAAPHPPPAVPRVPQAPVTVAIDNAAVGAPQARGSVFGGRGVSDNRAGRSRFGPREEHDPPMGRWAVHQSRRKGVLPLALRPERSEPSSISPARGSSP